MEKHKELVEIMLPEGILNIFEFRGMAKTPHSYKVTLEEKNRSLNYRENIRQEK